MNYPLLPGANVLGYGFNVLGMMDDSSRTQQLFTIQPPTNVFTDATSGTVYGYPANMDATALAQGSGSCSTFKSESEYVTWFNEKASLDISAWSASVNFDLDYSEATSQKSSYSYAMFNMDYSAWAIQYSTLSAADLSVGITSLVAALPSTYTVANRQAFFDFFDTYGTHYVNRIHAGGLLRYCVSVESSAYSDETKISVNVELEYDAVFGSSKGSSQTDWSELTTTWTSARNVNIRVVGGDSSVINAHCRLK